MAPFGLVKTVLFNCAVILANNEKLHVYIDTRSSVARSFKSFLAPFSNLEFN